MLLGKFRDALRGKGYWLFVAAYFPSMLGLAIDALRLPRVATRDPEVLAMAAYLAIGCTVPLVRLALSLKRREGKDATPWKPGARLTSWVLVINWVPHHLVLILLGLFMGIHSDGFVP
jgi:hypothetical protein